MENILSLISLFLSSEIPFLWTCFANFLNISSPLTSTIIGLFWNQDRIDVTAEDEIDLIRGVDGIEFDLYQIFEANFS